MDDRDKERVIVEVTHRVMDDHARDPRKVEKALFDTLYEERQRLKTEKDKDEVKRLSGYYKSLQRESAQASHERQRELLGELITHYTQEVSGHFDRRVYAAATTVLPMMVTGLLNTMSPMKLIGGLPQGIDTFGNQLVLQGEVELFKELAAKGTIVLVATHSSHMDSIMLGWAIYRLGLPPFTYGAGLNLFTNPVLSYFMHNLGAYRVDRRDAELYKDVLKAYCGCTSRWATTPCSSPAEPALAAGPSSEKLKLGLLGQGIDAYVRTSRTRSADPDVFVVPVTINYLLVLEAETLIDDYLQEDGKSRYIITDDEFSKPRVVLDFVRKLFSLDSRIHVTVGRPLDVFGNMVDDEGNSIDQRGRVIDRRRYVYRNGRPAFDKQRDMEFTVELADRITEEFHRDTVVKSTNLVSSAMFGWLRESNPELDLYKLLRAGGEEPDVPLADIYRRMESILKKLRRMSDLGRIRLDKTLSCGDTVLVMGEALAHFQSFHQQAAMVRHGDRLCHRDRNLIYYYRNRLTGFGLKEVEVGS